MRVKGIVFDMDGLLIDTESIYFRAWREAFKDSGLELTNRIFARMLGNQAQVIDSILLEEFDSQLDLISIRETKIRYFNQIVKYEGIKVRPGAREILDLLGSVGLAYSIATSTPHKEAQERLHRAGLGEYFTGLCIVGGDMVSNPKPAPDIYLKAMEQAQILPSDTLVFEDTIPGAQAALAAGAKVILIPNFYEVRQEDAGNYAAILPSLLKGVEYLKEFG